MLEPALGYRCIGSANMMRSDHRQVLLSLAGNIRMAMNVERGMLDLHTCLGVADALEALVLSDEAAFDPSLYPSGVGIDRSARAEEGPMSGASQSSGLRIERLREIFKLRSAKEYRCLILFLESQGRYMNIDEISTHLLSTPNSAKVYISHVRKCLEAIGMGNCIPNSRIDGYYMPTSIGRKLICYIEEYWCHGGSHPLLDCHAPGEGQ